MAIHTRSSQLLLMFLWGLSCQACADTFFITDQNGQPVKDAVIEFTGLDAASLVPRQKQTAVMDQINKRFLPELLVIRANDDVNFPNSDNIRHHVYSFSPAKPFELKLYSGQPNAPLLFEQPGIVVLGCNIHDSMVGYIYVAETEFVEVTDDKGLVSIDSNLVYKSLKVWHPYQSGGHMTVNGFRRDSLVLSSGDDQVFEITLSLQPPEPRNTFQNVFKHDH